MELVFERSVNDTELNSTTPPAHGFRAKPGATGTAVSAFPEPPVCHRVTMARPGGDSTSFALADLPVSSTTSPAILGISNCTGLLRATAPKCHAASATVKKLLASGAKTQAGDHG